MRKTLITISNISAFVNFLCLMATGAIMRWVLPPRSGGGFGHGAGRGRRLLDGEGVKTFLGWDRHDWGSLHFGLAAVLVCIVVLHLVLNWSWVRSNYFKRVRARQ